MPGQEVPIEQIPGVHGSISELEVPAQKAHFEDRSKNEKHLIILGSPGGSPAGYLVGYDRNHDGLFLLLDGRHRSSPPHSDSSRIPSASNT